MKGTKLGGYPRTIIFSGPKKTPKMKTKAGGKKSTMGAKV